MRQLLWYLKNLAQRESSVQLSFDETRLARVIIFSYVKSSFITAKVIIAIVNSYKYYLARNYAIISFPELETELEVFKSSCLVYRA